MDALPAFFKLSPVKKVVLSILLSGIALLLLSTAMFYAGGTWLLYGLIQAFTAGIIFAKLNP